MKKSILFFLAILLTSSSLHAQLTFGVKAGYNFSAFYKNKTEYMPGRNFGFYVERPLFKKTSITIELNNVYRGGVLRDIIVKPIFDYPPGYNVYVYDFFVKTDFIEIPLIIKYNYLLNKHINLRPYFGYSYSIPLDALPILLSEGDKTIRKNKRPVKNEDALKFDVYGFGEPTLSSYINAVLFGLSTTYRNRLLIDLRSVFGLTKFGGAGHAHQIIYKNYSFEVSLGFVFGTQTEK